MFQIPFSGTGSWIETLVLLAAGVAGLVYFYHTLAPRLERLFAERSDAGLRTMDLLHEQERSDAETDLSDLELDGALHDALHAPTLNDRFND